MSGLAYCGCGHTAEDHHGAGPCRHVNQGRKFPAPAPCTCQRFQADPRLVSSDDFVAKVLGKVLAKEGIPIEPVEREDALQVLAIALWKTAQKYDSRSHVRFRVYAYLELYNDAIDHFRAERGRHGQHRVYDPAAGVIGVGDGPVDTDRLDSTASRDPGDDPDTWAAPSSWIIAGGDLEDPGLAGQPRHDSGNGDPGRDPHPMRADVGRSRAEAA